MGQQCPPPSKLFEMSLLRDLITPIPQRASPHQSSFVSVLSGSPSISHVQIRVVEFIKGPEFIYKTDYSL